MHRSMHATLASARCCCAILPCPNSPEIRVWSLFDEVAKTFAIHASKNGQSVVTVRINPVLLSTERARWKAWAGKFVLPIPLGTGSILLTSIGFHRLLTKRPNPSYQAQPGHCCG